MGLPFKEKVLEKEEYYAKSWEVFLESRRERFDPGSRTRVIFIVRIYDKLLVTTKRGSRGWF